MTETSTQSSAHPSEEFKLRHYHEAVVGGSVTTLIVIAIITSYFQAYMPWMRHPALHFWLLIGVSFLQITLFILWSIFHKKIFFLIDRYMFIPFFFALLYAQGGVNSPFIWIIIFPLLVSVVDLDAKTIRLVGAIDLVGLALLLFANPEYLSDPVILTKYAINIIVLVTVSFYMYRIVRETLRQRYEKEKATLELDQLIQLDRIKSDFLATSSHQLRTPLSGISWGLETILQNDTLSPENRNMLLSVSKKVKEAISTVSDMLKTADYKIEEFSLNLENVNVNNFFAGILDSLEHLISSKQVKISISVPPTLEIVADSKLLWAAVVNVLDNAIRYSPNGKVSVTATTHKDGNQSSVVITVVDSGIGITTEDAAHIFERLYRGKNAIAIDPNESGVGLYVTKKIIERHGGTITFDSTEGVGTTVTITLPVKK